MTITKEIQEILQNSFLADLCDALETETDADLLQAIKNEIENRK